jgi:hypothetical protein
LEILFRADEEKEIAKNKNELRAEYRIIDCKLSSLKPSETKKNIEKIKKDPNNTITIFQLFIILSPNIFNVSRILMV